MNGIDDIVKRLLTSKKSKEKYFSAWLRLHWPTLCGERFSGRSRPGEIRGDILFVDVQDANWAHALLMKKKELLDKINRQTNGIMIRDIKFTARKRLPPEEPASAQGSDAQEKWPALEEQDAQTIQGLLEDVEDPKLKNKLFNLFASAKRRKKHDQQEG